MIKDDQDKEFTDLLEKHIGILLKIAGAYTKTPHDREDLVNDMILQLWKSYRTFEGRSTISTWLYRVALNTALSKRVKDRKQAVIFSDTLLRRHSTQLVTEDTSLHNMYSRLYESIEMLSDFDKAIVLLYLDGRSHEEIGQITGISTTNAGTRISRIKQQLKNIVHKK